MAENVENNKEKAPAMKKADSEAMRQSDKKEGGKTKLFNIDEFPTTIEGFGYIFNEEGKLRHIDTGEPFEFQVSDNMKYNQKHYEALGEIITEKIYELLESMGNLKKHHVPKTATDKDARSFFFMSEDALSNPDKLLILIHGSGVVRAGQWTRKLIINEDLDHGTQLPYIKRGMDEGYGIIVLNTNLNKVVIKGKEKMIKDNSDPEEHGIYVWKHFIKKAKAKHIAIVAHSYGGVVTSELVGKFKEDFEKRVFAVAFTDSVHSVAFQFGGAAAGRIFQKKARNWVTSLEPRDTPMRSKKDDAQRVSAGHEKHEWTSWAAFDSVFEYFAKMYPGTKDATSSKGTETSQNLVEEAEEAKETTNFENDAKKAKVETDQAKESEIANQGKENSDKNPEAKEDCLQSTEISNKNPEANEDINPEAKEDIVQGKTTEDQDETQNNLENTESSSKSGKVENNEEPMDTASTSDGNAKTEL